HDPQPHRHVRLRARYLRLVGDPYLFDQTFQNLTKAFHSLASAALRKINATRSSELVFRAWSTGSITKAALFRVIEMYHPTLLIDETDTFVGEDEELRGMLNHGHKYDGTVTRTVGEDHQPRKFDVYAAVALAGIGGLADTLADRSVVAELKRRRPSDIIARLRIGRMQHLHELRRRIVRWVADHEERIAERDPEIPSIIDREADNWQVLLAIADEAGEEWPGRARKV